MASGVADEVSCWSVRDTHSGAVESHTALKLYFKDVKEQEAIGRELIDLFTDAGGRSTSYLLAPRCVAALQR